MAGPGDSLLLLNAHIICAHEHEECLAASETRKDTPPSYIHMMSLRDQHAEPATTHEDGGCTETTPTRSLTFFNGLAIVVGL